MSYEYMEVVTKQAVDIENDIAREGSVNEDLAGRVISLLDSWIYHLRVIGFSQLTSQDPNDDDITSIVNAAKALQSMTEEYHKRR